MYRELGLRADKRRVARADTTKRNSLNKEDHNKRGKLGEGANSQIL